MRPTGVGDLAPDFTATSQTGAAVSLAEYRGRQAVVLYFYPRDFTPGCTAQACSFRDHYAEFVEAGAVVIGVSGNTAESHERFASHKQLPFLLVSDHDGSLRRRYGVPKTLWLLPGRVTYVIDRKGVVRLVFNSPWNAAAHIAEALAVVRSLAPAR